MPTQLRRKIVNVLMVFATAVMYTVLRFYVGSTPRSLIRLSKFIVDLFPVHMRGGYLFGFVLFTAEIPLVFLAGLAAALLMALLFRSASWRHGLMAALLAVVMFFYVSLEYYEYWGPFSFGEVVLAAYEMLVLLACLPLACVLLGRIWRFSGHPSQPSAASSG